MWTQFMDMNSGGGRKEQWSQIFIEADEDEAITVFFNRFGHNPNRVTCTCCGPDYSIHDDVSLMELTRFEREQITRHRIYKETGRYVGFDEDIEGVSIEELEAQDHVLIIRSGEIDPEERRGAVPVQGYVWEDG